MTELFSFKVREVGRFALRQMPLGKLSLHLVASRKAKLLPEKENGSKVLQKHSHSFDSLMNRNPFGFQGHCNLGLGVPGIDIERKNFEVEFR